MGDTLSRNKANQERKNTPLKSPGVISEKRIEGVEKDIKEEMWQLMAGTIKQGSKQFMEDLLEDEITSI